MAKKSPFSNKQDEFGLGTSNAPLGSKSNPRYLRPRTEAQKRQDKLDVQASHEAILNNPEFDWLYKDKRKK